MSGPNNEPAFPAAPNPNWTDEYAFGQRGMTLRDYFAGQALAGMLACPRPIDITGGAREVSTYADGYSACAYSLADQMLAARQTKVP